MAELQRYVQDVYGYGKAFQNTSENLEKAKYERSYQLQVCPISGPFVRKPPNARRAYNYSHDGKYET